MVADWIATSKDIDGTEIDDEDLPVPTVYEFNRSDDTLCRSNFRELESWYAGSYDNYKSE